MGIFTWVPASLQPAAFYLKGKRGLGLTFSKSVCRVYMHGLMSFQSMISYFSENLSLSGHLSVIQRHCDNK